jgi:hypothetical protein
MAQRNGTGIYPREVMNRFPLLPLEEEGRLNDMPLRENFIERVLPVEKRDRAYYRWTRMLDGEPTSGGLVRFHTAHKLKALMADSACVPLSQSERSIHRDVTSESNGDGTLAEEKRARGFTPPRLLMVRPRGTRRDQPAQTPRCRRPRHTGSLPRSCTASPRS